MFCTSICFCICKSIPCTKHSFLYAKYIVLRMYMVLHAAHDIKANGIAMASKKRGRQTTFRIDEILFRNHIDGAVLLSTFCRGGR